MTLTVPNGNGIVFRVLGYDAQGQKICDETSAAQNLSGTAVTVAITLLTMANGDGCGHRPCQHADDAGGGAGAGCGERDAGGGAVCHGAAGCAAARFSIPGAAVAGDDIGGQPIGDEDIVFLGPAGPGKLSLASPPTTTSGFTAKQLNKIIPVVLGSFEDAGVDLALAANQSMIQQFLDRYLANLSPASHPGLSFDDAFESDQEDRIKVLLTDKVANGSLTASFVPVTAADLYGVT